MLHVIFHLGSQQRRLILPWPCGHQTVIIGIDPDYPLQAFRCSWRGHRLKFNIPPSAQLNPVRAWKSQSQDSTVLFPWWWHCAPQTDVICMILPAGTVSSCHHHNHTAETFATVFGDGHTYIKIGDKAPAPLNEEQSIEVLPGVSHQLFRPPEAPNFSVHLLKMVGPVRFPSREDHIFHQAPKLSYA